MSLYPPKSVTAVEEEPPVDDREHRKVLNWRIDFLMAAGYDAEAAVLLAQRPWHEVDLHHAARLLEEGCTVTTALLILL